ncbi:hypothetical protein GmHk_03G006439 [Glycine max]|nr:hypothetical protein GmHk_03G006439 [Glycine max]
MDAWGSLVDCLSEHQFDNCLKKFEIPMFVDYVNETWIILHKEKFVTAWTNKVMHLGNTTTNRIEFAHWALKKVLHNSLGDLCSVWDAMNSMITLTHVVRHVFKVTLYKRFLGMVSRYPLNQITVEYERVHYVDKNPSRCDCVMRTTHDLPYACELSKYVLGSIPLDSIHMFWRRLSFSDQALFEPQELDVCGKVTLKSKLQEIAYPNQNSMCPPPEKVNTKVKCSASSFDQPIPRRIMLMFDQLHSFIHDFIDNIVDVKADSNCGYHAIATLLELGKWSDDYIKLFGGTNRFEELRRSLLVDGLSMLCNLCFVTMDKWMDITEM